MILYRGQATRAAVVAAAQRMPDWLKQALASDQYNAIAQAQGRWFTDELEIARWYVADANGEAEIVQIELPDEVAETYRVSNTPVTSCGLEPGKFSRDPTREFLLPRHFAEQASAIAFQAA